MKQAITYTQWDELPPNGKDLVTIWKERKYKNTSPLLTIGECIELLVAFTRNYHKDYADSRFFNNILINNESTIAWDGQEFIDILWFEVVQTVKRRLYQSRTFNDETAS